MVAATSANNPGLGVGIGVDEQKPIARGGGGPGVAGSGDLIDRLKYHLGTGSAGELGGSVGRIIIANDDFGSPPGLVESGTGEEDPPQCFRDQFFLVERRDDD